MRRPWRRAASGKRLAVIGAGAAGLVCARELLREGHEVTIFEQSERIGGVWVYDEAVEDEPLGLTPSRRLHGSLYASLRTNLPTRLMAFSDYPFDSRGGGADDWPAYPPHRLVLRYLEQFARDFGLLPHIRFRATVARVRPLADGWRLLTEPAESAPPETFDAVAVCNGHYSRPRVPSLPGLEQFRGRLLHSHNYRRPDAFRGQVLALWGTGSSGGDLSREIASVAAKVYWCGGDFSGRRQLAANLWQCPEPQSFVCKDRLEFHDGGRTERLDACIFCTGYEYDLPFLGKDLLQIRDNQVRPLYMDLLPPEHPTLACIGLPFLVIPFPLMEMQSRWFARLLSGRFRLPEPATQRRWIAERERRLRAAGRPARHYHQLGAGQFDYIDTLAAQCGAEPLPAWFRSLTEEVRRARLADPVGFRDLPLRVAAD